MTSQWGTVKKIGECPEKRQLPWRQAAGGGSVVFPLDSGLDLRSLWLDARKGGVELGGSTLKAWVVGSSDQCRMRGQRRWRLLSRSRNNCPWRRNAAPAMRRIPRVRTCSGEI